MGQRALGPYRIIVGITFDEAGQHAWDHAAFLASGRPDIQLHLVHVVEHIESSFEAIAQTGSSPKLNRESERLALFAKDALHKAPVLTNRTFLHLGFGSPKKELVQMAVDYDAQMIVVGSHRKGTLERALLGSVSASLTREAPCAVLVATDQHFGLQRSRVLDDPQPAATHVEPTAELARAGFRPAGLVGRSMVTYGPTWGPQIGT